MSRPISWVGGSVGLGRRFLQNSNAYVRERIRCGGNKNVHQERERWHKKKQVLLKGRREGRGNT